jgi:hypothetical protein
LVDDHLFHLSHHHVLVERVGFAVQNVGEDDIKGWNHRVAIAFEAFVDGCLEIKIIAELIGLSEQLYLLKELDSLVIRIVFECLLQQTHVGSALPALGVSLFFELLQNPLGLIRIVMTEALSIKRLQILKEIIVIGLVSFDEVGKVLRYHIQQRVDLLLQNLVSIVIREQICPLLA